VSAHRCRVSYQDRSGIEHAAEVTAETLYLAVAMAIAKFQNGFMPEDLLPDAMTKMTVEVLSDTTSSHVVAFGDVVAYGRQAGDRSPALMAKRARVKEMLGL
jgi:hypothetical protein